MGQCAEITLPFQLLFIELEKTFNSVNRECICSALCRGTIQNKLAVTIGPTYGVAAQNMSAVQRQNLRGINSPSGVQQRWIRLMILLLFVIGEVNAFSGSWHLDYWDDICLLSLSLSQATLAKYVALDSLEKAINVELKTKTIKAKILSSIIKLFLSSIDLSCWWPFFCSEWRCIFSVSRVFIVLIKGFRYRYPDIFSLS